MKDKIILFVIGVLVGAVISTGAFYVYTTTNSNNCSNESQEVNGGERPEMPSGQGGEMGQPPEMPNGQNGPGQQNNNQTNNN